MHVRVEWSEPHHGLVFLNETGRVCCSVMEGELPTMISAVKALGRASEILPCRCPCSPAALDAAIAESARIVLPVNAAPTVIAAEILTSLAVHGFAICERMSGPEILGEIMVPIENDRIDALVVQIGTDAARSLCALDES